MIAECWDGPAVWQDLPYCHPFCKLSSVAFSKSIKRNIGFQVPVKPCNTTEKWKLRNKKGN